MIPKLMEKVNQAYKRPEDIGANIVIGSSVDVHVKVTEGDKERIQIFPGTVICRKGSSSTETFTVRRVSHGIGVERVFPVHSPSVVKVEITKIGRVRRAKLNYLRKLRGKKARLRETIQESAK